MGSNLKEHVHTIIFLGVSIWPVIILLKAMLILFVFVPAWTDLSSSLRTRASEAWRSNDNGPHGRSSTRFDSVLHLLCIFRCSDIVTAFFCAYLQASQLPLETSNSFRSFGTIDLANSKIAIRLITTCLDLSQQLQHAFSIHALAYSSAVMPWKYKSTLIIT